MTEQHMVLYPCDASIGKAEEVWPMSLTHKVRPRLKGKQWTTQRDYRIEERKKWEGIEGNKQGISWQPSWLELTTHTFPTEALSNRMPPNPPSNRIYTNPSPNKATAQSDHSSLETCNSPPFAAKHILGTYSGIGAVGWSNLDWFWVRV